MKADDTALDIFHSADRADWQMLLDFIYEEEGHDPAEILCEWIDAIDDGPDRLRDYLQRVRADLDALMNKEPDPPQKYRSIDDE